MTPALPGEFSNLILSQNWQAIKKRLDSTQPDEFDGQSYFAQGLFLAFGPISHRNLVKAIYYLEKAQQLEPGNIQYLNTLSETYLQLKRPAMALRAATRASDLAPENLSSMIALGRAAWFCEEKELALNAFAVANRMAPPSMSSLKNHLGTITFSLASFWLEPRHGKRLTLVRMGPEHRDFLFLCRRDANFQHQYHLFRDSSPEAVDRELQLSNKSPAETRRISWIVENNKIPVGLAELVDLNFNNSRAEILVGFPQEQPFGVSLEATLLIMEFAFSIVGINKLISYVYGDNLKSQRNAIHLGFRQEGLLKSHVVDPATGERLDLFINGCLATEFFQNDTLMKLAKRLLRRIPQPDSVGFSSCLAGMIDVSKLIIDLPMILIKNR